MTEPTVAPDLDQVIDALRTSGQDDPANRIQLAEALLQRFERRSVAGDESPADVTEACACVDWFTEHTEPYTEFWWPVQVLTATAYEYAARLTGDVACADRAIRAAELYTRYTPDADGLIGLAFLRLLRYNLTSGAMRDAFPSLAPAADELELASTLFPSEEQRRAIDVLLGIVLSQQAIAGPVTDTARAIALLRNGITYLELGDPLREMALCCLGDLHFLRYNESDRRDDVELDDAIDVYREAAEDYGGGAVADLVRALVMRTYDRPDPADREEALRHLERLTDPADPASIDAEQAEQIGELLLDRAKQQRTPDSWQRTISFLEGLIDRFGPADGVLHTQLITAYSLFEPVTPNHLDRVVKLVDDIESGDPAGAPDLLLSGLRAAAIAERALLSGAAADLEEARLALTAAAESGAHLDGTQRGLLAGLGIVVAAQAGSYGDSSPVRVFDHMTVDDCTGLIGWLRQHLPAIPPSAPGYAEYVAAIALLGTAVLPPDDAPADTRAAALRDVLADLRQADGSPCPGWPLRLLVRQQLAARTSELGRITGSIDDVVAGLTILAEILADTPANHPLRTDTLAYFSANALSGRLLGRLNVDLSAAEPALAEALDDPALEPERRAIYLTALGLLSCADALNGPEQPRYRRGVSCLESAVATLPDGHPEQAFPRYLLALLLASRFQYVGDVQDIAVARSHFRIALDQVRRGETDGRVPETDVLTGLRQAELLLARAGQLPDAEQKAADLIAVARGRPDRDVGTSTALGLALATQAMGTGDVAQIREAAQTVIAAAGQVPEGSVDYPAAQAMLGCLLASVACVEGNRGTLRRGLTIIERQVNSADFPDRDKPALVFLAGRIWHEWSVATGDRPALDRAVELVEAGFGMIPAGSELRGGSGLYRLAAEVYWHRGRPLDIRHAVDLELRALRERAREVVLQSESEQALAIVADAAERATTLAARCLAVGLKSDAVRAVEAGRGLVLHAATASADIPALLRHHGHDDLAAEWARESAADRSAVPDGLAGQFGLGSWPVAVPSGLRHRVLTALASTDATRVLLEIPTADDIAAALRAQEFDALVYLLPSADHGPGRALMVSADAVITDIPLPMLRSAELGVVRTYVDARRAAETDQRDELAEQWHRDLEALCEWAWQAVIAPLRLRCPRPAERLPRLVLVPTGVLGVVPWHAARDNRSPERRALHEFVISYASSARQLCVLAGRQQRPLAEAPVVVADPTATLRGATVEAEYVAARYPATRYLGVRRDGRPAYGAGEPQEILDVLPGGGRPGATMVHFGCHAVSGPTPATSYLRLAGDTRLTVDRIMRAAADRPATPSGGLVVLAACQSGLTQAAHDEGLTLANAFVTAGATGVTAALWAIPDRASSVLMCLYHNELGRPGARPAEALRRVALWALEDGRSLPADFPAELLSCVDSVDFRDAAVWGAFTQHGR